MERKAKLHTIADVSLGQTFRERAETDKPISGIRLIQIKDIREGELSDVSGLPYADIEPSKLKVKLIDGDLLLPLRGTRTEAMIFRKGGSREDVTTTNQVAIIRPKDGLVTLDYLHWFFNSDIGSLTLDSIRTAATIPNISVRNLVEITLPVPDDEAQKEVVAIYNNWRLQKENLHELIINGEAIMASAAQKILSRGLV
ncbi:restriction endonuclease subunit M [Pseudomonas brassicacearum]|uniref:restriction endonuclease subunit S n=1 Tax=Pseudomonas brassicacearum TaxID=930166 RepID=UPI00042EE46B|nr:restriction endonuclease subunit S [Pseudomonas brassicacearum]AHL36134.1 restriction endonuclease subunit M [Pseudomonas brassicacearum]